MRLKKTSMTETKKVAGLSEEIRHKALWYVGYEQRWSSSRLNLAKIRGCSVQKVLSVTSSISPLSSVFFFTFSKTFKNYPQKNFAPFGREFWPKNKVFDNILVFFLYFSPLQAKFCGLFARKLHFFNEIWSNFKNIYLIFFRSAYFSPQNLKVFKKFRFFPLKK